MDARPNHLAMACYDFAPIPMVKYEAMQRLLADNPGFTFDNVIEMLCIVGPSSRTQ